MLSSAASIQGQLVMSVDQATVRRIARLARIKVKDEDVPKLAGELSSILQWIEQLNEVDVSKVEPLTSVVAMNMKMRQDEVTDGHYAPEVVKNAPRQEDNFFMVPKVVE
jgi:aspartyl-tRNA(Asn)/glutamyl-tRNA(Gln) amidotransferase subunit C